MSWKRQKVLITGAGGFIGSHLAEKLVELGADVRALVHYNALGRAGWLDRSAHRQEMDVRFGDIMDAESVRRSVKGCDVVFHLAALIGIPYSYHAPLSYVRTNIEGSLNVFHAAREFEVARVVHTSTSEVYGTAETVPMNERHALQAQSPYAASKIGADKMAEAFHLCFQLPVVTIRPFNTYGPRQSARAIVPTIIMQALSGRKISLGNLHPTRDLNFVADTVNAFVLAGSCSRVLGKTFNIGSGCEVSVRKLAGKVLALMGKEGKIEIVSHGFRKRPKASEVDRLCAENRYARKILGWKPSIGLDEGLAQTILWFETHLGQYDVESYAV